MDNKMDSHEYAHKLQEMAVFLLARDKFKVECSPYLYLRYWTGQKTEFLDAAKALGSGAKDYTATEFRFTVQRGAKLVMAIDRSVVCRKVQEEKWECEPLLSEQEVAQVGA